MKRIAIAAAVAFLVLGGTAQAQTMPQLSKSGLYGELGYTWFKIDAAGTSARPSGIRGVPHFVIGARELHGAQAPEALRDAMLAV